MKLHTRLATIALLALTACEPSGKAPAGHPPRPEIIKAEAGKVSLRVREAQAAAARDSRRLVVYVGAEWCEPCQRFLDAVEADSLPDRFDDLRFLKFDYDADGPRLKADGFGSQWIPNFVIPDSSGLATERRFEGSIKGPEAIGDLVAKLDRLLEIDSAQSK